MRKNYCLLFLLFLLLIPNIVFTYSREEIISQTLTQMELILSLQTESYPSNSTIWDVKLRKHLMEEINADRESISNNQENQKNILSEINPDEQKGSFYISGGYNANHIHYKETRGERTLDEEYGKLKGFYVALGYRSPNYYEVLLGKPFVEAYFRRSANLITYDGGTSAGNDFQFDDQKAKIFRYGIKLGGYRDFLSERGDYFGYFDIGQRVWYRAENRILQGVLIYAEKYWWTYFGAGAGFNYKLIPQVSTGIDFEMMFSNSHLAKMRADLYEGGTFELKNVYGLEVKAPIKYYFLKNISFDVTPYFTYWHIKESDPVLISGAYYVEPDSRTHIEGLLTGFTYNF